MSNDDEEADDLIQTRLDRARQVREALGKKGAKALVSRPAPARLVLGDDEQETDEVTS